MESEDVQRPCICGNEDSKMFRRYHGDKCELHGVFCKSCGKEWLQERFHQSSPVEMFIVVRNQRLYFRGKIKTSTYTRSIADWHMIRGGDHLRWSELNGQSEKLTFDAIVGSTDADSRFVSVIMLQKLRFCELTVGRMHIDLSKIGELQIIDNEPDCDPPELVVARALAWCESEAENMFTAKSKAFANYCKCGPSHGWRAVWLAGAQVTQVLRTVFDFSWVSGREEDCKSVVERGYTKTKLKTGILFVMDGSAVGFELETAIKEQREDTNRERFLDCLIKKFIDLLVARGYKISGPVALGASGGGIGSLETSAIEVKTSFFIGSVIKGAVLMAPQKAVGSSLGRVFGQMIHMSVKRGDEEVHLDDVRGGDHVVLPGHVGHPRCHAVVVSVNAKTRKLKLIRNTYERGVVEEWVVVSPPILRVSHGDVKIFPADAVVQRARSKLGENRYNIFTNNCKHFAVWCKCE